MPTKRKTNRQVKSDDCHFVWSFYSSRSDEGAKHSWTQANISISVQCSGLKLRVYCFKVTVLHVIHPLVYVCRHRVCVCMCGWVGACVCEKERGRELVLFCTWALCMSSVWKTLYILLVYACQIKYAFSLSLSLSLSLPPPTTFK